MEVGIVPRIDQYKDNINIQMQQVKSSADSASINNEKNLEQIQQEAISKAKKKWSNWTSKSRYCKSSFEIWIFDF